VLAGIVLDSLEQFVPVETPEQLELQLELAGVGSRFLAFVVDLLWQLVVIVVLIALGVALIPSARRLEDLEVGSGKFQLPLLWIAIATTALFVVNFGYFVIFELLWRGQTPGKRSVGIRVVREGGFPLDATASLLRNFLRSLDSLPAFYLVGVVAAFLSPSGQRLGDLVARTLVVREPRRDGGLRLPAHRDSDAEIAADFLARRLRFPHAADASRLAHELALAAAARRGLPPPEDPEAFLQSLVRELH
jgi:uncharacterized RDD family membrane protein YckC